MIEVLLVSLSLTAHASLPPSDLPDRVEKILPSVVNVSSVQLQRQGPPGTEEFFRFWNLPQNRPQTSLGSGFIIDSEGFVITNNHVVGQASEVFVTLQDKRQFKARLIGKDSKMDVALLQIRDDSGKVPSSIIPAKLGNSDTVRIAETVIAIGNPFGLQHTVTTGIISAKNRTIGVGPLDNFLQTDAAINPGNSGGPLFNLNGEVIGINTLIYSKTGQSGGLGFAIPVNEARAIIPTLKQFGRVPRPWLGVLTERVTPQIAAYYQLPRKDGVLVYQMVENAPAERAGLKAGDIVFEAQGTGVKEPIDLERVLAKLGPKDALKLKIQRDQKVLERQVSLQELPPQLVDRLREGVL